jgi:hypothetical protein
MATVTTKKDMLPVTTSTVKEGAFRRYIVKRAHPTALFLDTAALIWAIYFLWYHAWQMSLLILVVQRTFTWFLIQPVDSDQMSRTLLGKLALLHIHPFNLAIQTCGLIVTGWGIWLHETVPVLGGISLILIGHGFGWRHVHKALDCRRSSVA